MGQVTVIVNGRSYRLRCGEGEEQRLIDLAENVRQRIDDLSYEFGHAGDERLLLMAALMVTDELWDAKAKLAAAEAKLAAGGHGIVEHVDLMPAADDDVTAATASETIIRERDAVAALRGNPDKPAQPPADDASSPLSAGSAPSPADANFVQEPSLKRALRRAPTPAKASLDDRLTGARDGTPPARSKSGTT